MAFEYYEYKQVVGPLSVEQLNGYGSQGWELVTVVLNIYTFKREREVGDE